jgi:hypothetical protein
MKLEGEIGEISLIERLVELGREQFTGAIRFENDGIIKIIYFKTGDILSASTNDRADSIDEILMRANKVSREHVKQALAKRKESETLGDALLGLGFITKKELTWARRVQVIGVIRSIATWQTGSFTVVADYLPKREEGTLFPLPQIVTELIVTDNDRAKFDAALDGGNAVLTKVPDFDESFRRLGLNQEAAAIAANIDGTNSASEVAMLSGTDTFNVYKLLHALHVLGLLANAPKPQVEAQSWSMPASSDDFNFHTEAVADAADMWNEPGPTAEIPAPTPMPAPAFEASFESNLEDAPSLDLPPMNEPAFETAPDVEPEPDAMEPPSMPAWDTPAPPPITPMQSFEKSKRMPEPPPVPVADEQWGFDEAQIETAARAAVPVNRKNPPPMKEVVKKASKPGRWVDALIVSVSIVIIGFSAYAVWMWWQAKQAEKAAEAMLVKRPAKRPVIRPTPPPPVVVPTATQAATTATVAPTPVPVAAKPSPMVITSSPTTARVEQTTSGALITNAGAGTPSTPVAPATAADTARYEAMAREFAADKSGNFTVQFELVCEPASITKALREGSSNVWFLPISYRGRSCYRVFWGRYATQQAAQNAIASIPQTLREATPVVVHVPK